MILTAAFVALPLLASADDWQKYDAPEYGFEMMVPAGTKFKEAEKGGWGYLEADIEGVKLYALAKKKCNCTLDEAEAFAEKLVGVGEWKKIDQGKDKNGFKEHRTYETNAKGKLAFGGVGIGTNGNGYAFVLVTTEDDYNSNKDDYKKWHDSCRAK
jgi:hypothetical protein